MYDGLIRQIRRKKWRSQPTKKRGKKGLLSLLSPSGINFLILLEETKTIDFI